MTFKLASYALHQGFICEACGTKISHIYTLRDDDGGTIRVGSECASKLIGIGWLAPYERARKLAQAGAAEWRKRRFVNMSGERERYITDYVSRRLHIGARGIAP